jgi:hypothetical protein
VTVWQRSCSVTVRADLLCKTSHSLFMVAKRSSGVPWSQPIECICLPGRVVVLLGLKVDLIFKGVAVGGMGQVVEQAHEARRALTFPHYSGTTPALPLS